MKFFNFNKKDTPQPEALKQPFYSEFSTPFGKINKGDLSRPYIRVNGPEPYVRFGTDNLYPQLINQLYYTPLNGAIIDFKTLGVIGNGFVLECVTKTGEQRVKEFEFMRRNSFQKLIRQTTKDLIMHGRVCIHISRTSDGAVTLKRVGPEKVRTNEAKTVYTVCDDWSVHLGKRTYPKHSPTLIGESMFCFEIDDTAGQDVYPLPSYISALNWAFLEGEMSYLHKSNIINSVFPSFMITLAKNFGSAEAELEQFKRTIDAAKGAPEAGRIMTFIANSSEQLPSITEIPTSQNDKLFTQTDERLDATISRAHMIDPLLMGIRVSGKLGSGTDLEQARLIFEQFVIRPLREMVEEFANELLQIGGIDSVIKINTTAIVNDKVVDTTQADSI